MGSMSDGCQPQTWNKTELRPTDLLSRGSRLGRPEGKEEAGVLPAPSSRPGMHTREHIHGQTPPVAWPALRSGVPGPPHPPETDSR